jgi:hypothetical protein
LPAEPNKKASENEDKKDEYYPNVIHKFDVNQGVRNCRNGEKPKYESSRTVNELPLTEELKAHNNRLKTQAL